MYALSPNVDVGTLRETFVASMLYSHLLAMPDSGDLQVDETYIFEVGGKKKNFGQIANIRNSYVVADGIDVGMYNKIPLWIMGFLY